MKRQPRSRRAAIRLSRVLDRVGLAAPAFRLYERLQARRARGLPIELDDGLPLPPAHLRYVVTGSGDAERFLATGRADAASIRGHLGEALDRRGRLLDFGVGCGRIARHWPSLAPRLAVHGCDYNPRLVAWVQAHLHFVDARRNGLAPPLGYPNARFDVVYAVSVLTHLPVELQAPWMSELARVLAPGGRLLVTTHGESTLGHMLDDERERFARGELVVRNAGAAGSNLCSTYHPPGWVRAHLFAGLRELAFRPGDPAMGQDVWLLEPAA